MNLERAIGLILGTILVLVLLFVLLRIANLV